ncbi:MAG: hypothetical protein H7Z41_01900 [Cytophagales bacterium]|nr:hypothetical protein [Armatimonadota bacterium]
MKLSLDNIADYADTLVLQVQGGGRTLDYSEASIATLEDLLRVSDELLRSDNFPDAQRNLVVFYNGCYLGEVLSRNLIGVWRFDDNWYDSRIVFPYQGGGIQIQPFHKLFRRVTEGPEENDLVAYYEGLKTRIEGDSIGGDSTVSEDPAPGPE